MGNLAKYYKDARMFTSIRNVRDNSGRVLRSAFILDDRDLVWGQYDLTLLSDPKLLCIRNRFDLFLADARDGAVITVNGTPYTLPADFEKLTQALALFGLDYGGTLVNAITYKNRDRHEGVVDLYNDYMLIPEIANLISSGTQFERSILENSLEIKAGSLPGADPFYTRSLSLDTSLDPISQWSEPFLKIRGGAAHTLTPAENVSSEMTMAPGKLSLTPNLGADAGCSAVLSTWTQLRPEKQADLSILIESSNYPKPAAPDANSKWGEIRSWFGSVVGFNQKSDSGFRIHSSTTDYWDHKGSVDITIGSVTLNLIHDNQDSDHDESLLGMEPGGGIGIVKIYQDHDPNRERSTTRLNLNPDSTLSLQAQYGAAYSLSTLQIEGEKGIFSFYEVDPGSTLFSVDTLQLQFHTGDGLILTRMDSTSTIETWANLNRASEFDETKAVDDADGNAAIVLLGRHLDPRYFGVDGTTKRIMTTGTMQIEWKDWPGLSTDFEYDNFAKKWKLRATANPVNPNSVLATLNRDYFVIGTSTTTIEPLIGKFYRDLYSLFMDSTWFSQTTPVTRMTLNTTTLSSSIRMMFRLTADREDIATPFWFRTPSPSTPFNTYLSLSRPWLWENAMDIQGSVPFPTEVSYRPLYLRNIAAGVPQTVDNSRISISRLWIFRLFNTNADPMVRDNNYPFYVMVDTDPNRNGYRIMLNDDYVDNLVSQAIGTGNLDYNADDFDYTPPAGATHGTLALKKRIDQQTLYETLYKQTSPDDPYKWNTFLIRKNWNPPHDTDRNLWVVWPDVRRIFRDIPATDVALYGNPFAPSGQETTTPLNDWDQPLQRLFSPEDFETYHAAIDDPTMAPRARIKKVLMARIARVDDDLKSLFDENQFRLTGSSGDPEADRRIQIRPDAQTISWAAMSAIMTAHLGAGLKIDTTTAKNLTIEHLTHEAWYYDPAAKRAKTVFGTGEINDAKNTKSSLVLNADRWGVSTLDWDNAFYPTFQAYFDPDIFSANTVDRRISLKGDGVVTTQTLPDRILNGTPTVPGDWEINRDRVTDDNADRNKVRLYLNWDNLKNSLTHSSLTRSLYSYKHVSGEDPQPFYGARPSVSLHVRPDAIRYADKTVSNTFAPNPNYANIMKGGRLSTDTSRYIYTQWESATTATEFKFVCYPWYRIDLVIPVTLTSAEIAADTIVNLWSLKDNLLTNDPYSTWPATKLRLMWPGKDGMGTLECRATRTYYDTTDNAMGHIQPVSTIPQGIAELTTRSCWPLILPVQTIKANTTIRGEGANTIVLPNDRDLVLLGRTQTLTQGVQNVTFTYTVSLGYTASPFRTKDLETIPPDIPMINRPAVLVTD